MQEPLVSGVVEHAVAMGVDLRAEPFLWPVVEEALFADLPSPWEEVRDSECNFYYNRDTGESTYRHPLEDHYADLLQEMRRLAAQGTTPCTPMPLMQMPSNSHERGHDTAVMSRGNSIHGLGEMHMPPGSFGGVGAGHWRGPHDDDQQVH